MTDWRPPQARIRAVPHLAGEVLHLGADGGRWMVTHRGSGRFDRTLWIRMRRLLPPVYWESWFTIPGRVRLFTWRFGFFVGWPAVGNYNMMVERLQVLAEELGKRAVRITVGQGAAWTLLRNDGRRAGHLTALVDEIADWHEVDPSGQGWLWAAAGIAPQEYASMLRSGEPMPDVDALRTLAVLRGHLLPHPDDVPVLASVVVPALSAVPAPDPALRRLP